MTNHNLIRKITMCECPVCNKHPKAYLLRDYTPYLVMLECKRHKRVFASGEYDWIAIMRAINKWNSEEDIGDNNGTAGSNQNLE